MLERIRFRLIGSVLLWDLLLTHLALFLSAHLRLALELGQDLSRTDTQLHWSLYVIVSVTWVVVFLILTPQRALFTRGLLEAIGRLVGAVALAGMSFAGVLYVSFRDVSRLQFFYFVLIDLLLLIVFHLFMRGYVRYRNRAEWHRRVLVVGEPAAAERLADEFAQRPWAGLSVIGYVSDTLDAPCSLDRLGKIGDTDRVALEQGVEEVIFALPSQQHDRIAELSLSLIRQPVMMHMVPSTLDLAFARTPVESLGGIPVVSLRESALTDSQRILKRLFDISASFVLLVAFAPLLLLIAIVIKLESAGPVFFLQERIGEHGRRFRMIKFRSMYADAERRWHEVARRDQDGRLIHKSENDPRITWVGRKLRRASLDELPQLINVIRGEMSLVGPRPEMPYVAAEYESWQWQRFRVPPGITGWWQVNGRSDKPMHLHTEDDLYYIQNYSFWLDLRILLKTVVVVVSGHGAY